MNIYNNSTAGTTASYPQNATFSTIETGTLQIDSTFIIQGATKGGLLVCEDNTNDIGQINLGDKNFLLASDKTATDLPVWVNDITINKITSNLYNYVGITTGDLLVGEATGNLGRLPAGTADQVLFSDGTNLGWQSLTALNKFLQPTGTFTLNDSPTTAYTDNSLAVTAGRRYRIIFNCQINLTALTQLSFTLTGYHSRNGTYTATGDACAVFIFSVVSDGFLPIVVSGQASPGSTSVLSELSITLEEF